MTVEDVLTRLDGVRPSARGWLARCPAHRDRRPSLSVASGDQRKVLVHCFAGCSYAEVLGALGFAPVRSGPPTSRHRDVHALALRLAQCQRWADPVVREMMAASRFICESHRAADSLRRKATASGPTLDTWDALALAATYERAGHVVAMLLDEGLAC